MAFCNCETEPTRTQACESQGQENQTCSTGCIVCHDSPGELNDRHVVQFGKRWLRPHPAWRSRDAYGRYTPLISGVPKLVRMVNAYERGACYFQIQGAECFEASFCDCWPAADHENFATGTCPDQTPRHQIMAGARTDCNFRTGSGWPPSLRCRLAGETGPVPVEVLPGPIGQAAFLASVHHDKYCSSNMVIPCTAQVVGSACSSGYTRTLGYRTNPHSRYLDGSAGSGVRETFRYITLYRTAQTDDIPQIGYGPNMPHAEQSIVGIKNKALARMLGAARDNPAPFPNGGTGIKFDRVESVALRAPWAIDPNGDITSDNSGLNRWDRVWDGPALVSEGRIVPEQFPVFETLTGRLRQAGCAVTVDLLIVRAKVELHMIMHKVCRRSAVILGTYRDELWPAVKILIEAEIGGRVRPPAEPCVIRRPWSKNGDRVLTLVNPANNEGYPRVAEEADEILYQDSTGKTMSAPPRRVQWWGYLGAFSKPAWTNRWPADLSMCHQECGLTAIGDQFNEIEDRCRCVRAAIYGPPGGNDTLVVPGWPTLAGSHPANPNQVYNGAVRLV